MALGSIHAAGARTPLFTMWRPHFLHPFVCGHAGLLHLLAVVSHAVVTVGVQISKSLLLCGLGRCPEMELLLIHLLYVQVSGDALPPPHTVFKKAVEHFPLFLYMAEKCSLWIHPVLSIHSSLDGHLSSSWLFAVVNNAAKNSWASFCLNIIVISLGYYLGVGVYPQLGNCIIYYEETSSCCTQTAHFTFPQAKVRGSNSSASLATCDFQFSWL